MVDRIPVATPYPWAPGEKKISPGSSRKRMGSGLAFLRDTVVPHVSTSDEVKRLLYSLVGDELLQTSRPATPKLVTTSLLDPASLLRSVKRRAVDPSMNEETTICLAHEGHLSLFQSILNMVDKSPVPVSAKQILRHCALAVRPGTVPAILDAKEFVLAALYFLSSNGIANSEDLGWTLPVIRCMSPDADLEKRTYGSIEGLSVSEEGLRWLEAVFETSAGAQHLLAREHMATSDMDTKEEVQLMLRGTVPFSARPKKQSGVGTTKRKLAVARSPPPEQELVAETTPLYESSSAADAVAPTVLPRSSQT